LRTFLEAVAGRFESVRQLDFDFFARYKGGTIENTEIELAVECTGPCTITLAFQDEELTYCLLGDEYGWQCETRPHSITQLFSRYKLERLLGCGMLNTMIIKNSGCWIAEEAEEATEELGQMIEKRFAARQSKQVVKVVYT
jgi:hypothetical protein